MTLFKDVCWIPLGPPCGSVGAHQEPIIVTSPEDHISDSHLQQTWNLIGQRTQMALDSKMYLRFPLYIKYLLKQDLF